MRVLTVVMVVCCMLAACGDPNYVEVAPVVPEVVAPVEPPTTPSNITYPSGAVTVTLIYPNYSSMTVVTK